MRTKKLKMKKTNLSKVKGNFALGGRDPKEVLEIKKPTEQKTVKASETVDPVAVDPVAEAAAKAIVEARTLLIEEEQRALNAFSTEISEVCAKHGFTLKVNYEIVAVKT